MDYVLLIVILILTPIIIYYMYLFSYFTVMDIFKSQSRYRNYMYNSEEYIDMSHRFNNIPIYYINLDRSPDRRQYMEQQFKQFNIKNTTRIPAIDGKLIKDKTKGSYNHPFGIITYSVNGYEKYTESELGCTLSHLLTIQTAYKNGDEYAIICEDDLSMNFLPYWENASSINDVIKKAPEDWTIINLNGRTTNPLCHIYKDLFIHHNSLPCFSTAIYIINKTGMENILRRMTHNNFIIDYDHCESMFLYADLYIYKCAGNTYAYTDELFYQNRVLDTTITVGWA